MRVEIALWKTGAARTMADSRVEDFAA